MPRANGSVEAILAWAAGEAPPPFKSPDFHALRPCPSHEVEIEHPQRPARHPSRRAALPGVTVIETGGNLGCAGGNNAGIRFALEGADIDIVWLLNNDTVVQPQAPAAIVAAFADDPAVGMLGSPLRYYHDPARHQMLNGMPLQPLDLGGRGHRRRQRGRRAGGSACHRPRYLFRLRRQPPLAVTRAFLDQVWPDGGPLLPLLRGDETGRLRSEDISPSAMPPTPWSITRRAPRPARPAPRAGARPCRTITMRAAS